MKKLLIILMFISIWFTSCIPISAQTIRSSKLYPKTHNDCFGSYDNFELHHTWWDDWGQSTAITLWQISSTALNAVGDGLNHNGDKVWGHTCNAVAYAMYMSGPFVLRIERQDWFPYLLGAIAMRFTFFDPIHNLTIGEEWYYIGDQSFYDKLIQQFKVPPHGWAFVRGISFTLVIGINYKNW